MPLAPVSTARSDGELDQRAARSIVIRNDVSELARVGAWVKDWARGHNLPVTTAERIDLCSVEAVTNIVTHGYADDAVHQIRLSLERDADVVSLEIEDDGMPFDPRLIARPERPARLADAKIGGLGVHIVRSLSDELLHQRCGELNRMRLVFRLRGPQSAVTTRTKLEKQNANE
jgi:serine/threonine-protein kinase RsbW